MTPRNGKPKCVTLAAWAKAATESRVGDLERQLCDVVRSTVIAIEALEHEIAGVPAANFNPRSSAG
jgi:hypothetical protein